MYYTYRIIFFISLVQTTIFGMAPLWNAQKYMSHSSYQDQVALDALAQISLHGNENILDVGCGDGKITYTIAQNLLAGTVHGIDISHNMIIHARTTHISDNLSFEQADVVIFNAPAIFDLITSFACFHWVKNQQQALINMAHALKPTGTLLITTVYEHNNPYKESRYDLLVTDKWAPYFQNYEYPARAFDEECIITLLENANLKPIKIEVMNKPFIFASRDDFHAWVAAVPSALERIPVELREEFINDKVEAYLQKIPVKENGEVELYAPVLLIIAQKI